MRVLVTPDYRTLSRTAAELILKAIAAKPDLVLALPTGSTPLGLYEELVRRFREENRDFSGVTTFNLDEYLGLPQAHPNSYHTYMRRQFFDHVNIPASNIHIPDGSPEVDPDVESRLYEKAIQDAGGIDLLIMGIGANGHIAFNEPGSPLDSRTRAVQLTAETIQNARRYFSESDPPSRAITIGIGTILEARRIVLLASGSHKADAVERALHGPVSESAPASALQLHANVIVIPEETAYRRGGE
jgi:glucosamine-6-phosphate deaminase